MSNASGQGDRRRPGFILDWANIFLQAIRALRNFWQIGNKPAGTAVYLFVTLARPGFLDVHPPDNTADTS